MERDTEGVDFIPKCAVGGITRLKNHLTGMNVGMKPCPKASQDSQ